MFCFFVFFNDVNLQLFLTVRQHDEQHDDGYPVELSGSCSSLCSYSGPAPHISMASSSRATTPDQDVSMCSDATLDCSPPSPVQVGAGNSVRQVGRAPSGSAIRRTPVCSIAYLPGALTALGVGHPPHSGG